MSVSQLCGASTVPILAELTFAASTLSRRNSRNDRSFPAALSAALLGTRGPSPSQLRGLSETGPVPLLQPERPKMPRLSSQRRAPATFRLPRPYTSQLRMEQLEDRTVPVNGQWLAYFQGLPVADNLLDQAQY